MRGIVHTLFVLLVRMLTLMSMGARLMVKIFFAEYNITKELWRKEAGKYENCLYSFPWLGWVYSDLC